MPCCSPVAARHGVPGSFRSEVIGSDRHDIPWHSEGLSSMRPGTALQIFRDQKISVCCQHSDPPAAAQSQLTAGGDRTEKGVHGRDDGGQVVAGPPQVAPRLAAVQQRREAVEGVHVQLVGLPRAAALPPHRRPRLLRLLPLLRAHTSTEYWSHMPL